MTDSWLARRSLRRIWRDGELRLAGRGQPIDGVQPKELHLIVGVSVHSLSYVTQVWVAGIVFKKSLMPRLDAVTFHS